jgi:hypothetical protein
MKKCIIFASHIPSPEKLSVGLELLNIFVKSFNEYDIYIGINNSCQEWHDCIEEYSKYLNIFCETTPGHLLIDSDASAFQSALRLLKNTGKKYGIYWFGHTKGATSGSHHIRNEITNIFWNKKEIIEKKIIEEGFSMYSPFMGTCSDRNGDVDEKQMNSSLSLFINGHKNNGLSSYFTFWVHSGEVVNRFLEESKDIFFSSRLIDLKINKAGITIDRYFFERDFPMIYQKFVKNPKTLFHKLLLHNQQHSNYVMNRCSHLSF